MADEIQRLILEVKGRQQAEELRETLKAEEQTLRELNKIIAQNAPLTQAQAKQFDATAKSMVDNQKEIKRLESSYKNIGGASMQLSYAFQDLFAQQGDLLRGFMAIQNNMPGIITSLGGSMGLAGAISMVSMAISLAMPMIVKFIESLSPSAVDRFSGALEILQTKLKAIQDKEIHIGTDASDVRNLEKMIERIQKGLEGFKQWEHEHTDWEQKSGSEVGHTLANDPEGKAAFKAVEASRQTDVDSYAPYADARKRNELLKDRLERFKDDFPRRGKQIYAITQNELKQSDQEMIAQHDAAQQHAGAQIGETYAKAKEGDQEAQKRLAERLRKAGYGSLAHSVEQRSAVNLKADAEREQQDEAKAEAFTKEEEFRRLQKQHHGAAQDWKALSAKRRATYYQGPHDTEMAAFGRFAGERDEQVIGEALHPEPPKNSLEEAQRIPDLQTRLNRMTPAERERYDQNAAEVNRADHQLPFRPVSPNAQMHDQVMSEAIKTRRDDTQGLQPAAQQMIGYMEEIQQENATLRAFIRKLGTAAARQQQNTRMMNGGMFVNGMGGVFGGNDNY